MSASAPKRKPAAPPPFVLASACPPLDDYMPEVPECDSHTPERSAPAENANADAAADDQSADEATVAADAPQVRAETDAKESMAAAAAGLAGADAAPAAGDAQGRMFAPDTTAKPAFGAASGWRDAMAGQPLTDSDAMQAETPVVTATHEATDGGDADADMATELQADDNMDAEVPAPRGLAEAGDDAVDLFFLDAQYEPAQPGTVFLLGKINRGGAHVSACVAVHNIRQTLFVVPKPFTFRDSDGELERCAFL